MSKLYLIANTILNRLTHWLFDYNNNISYIQHHHDDDNKYIPVEDNTFYGDNIQGRHTANCCDRRVIEVSGKLTFGMNKCNTCNLQDMTEDTSYATDDKCVDCPIKETMMNYACYDSKYTNENQNTLLTEIKSHYGIRHTNIN